MTARQTPIKVLIVDDSALMRQMLTEFLSSDPEIEVVGAAPHPLIARSMIKELTPDVLTLDIEMPQMDGLSFLERLMALRPMPVVMVSSLTQAGADAALQALELGAVDFIGKPKVDLRSGMVELRAELIEKVKAAAGSRPRTGYRLKQDAGSGRGWGGSFSSSEKIIAIGASTGGVEALRELLCVLPPAGPAVLVVQHMPALFTASFAARLNGLAAATIQEARDQVRVLPGHVYIAPGNFHLELKRSGANYLCAVSEGPLVSGHRPSVDMLFHSVARSAGANAVGVILTGMGRDGADGMLAMRRAGALTIGEDVSTCVVYGMPKAARDVGATQIELPLGRILPEVLSHCRMTGQTQRV
ncbi:MAG TPA: chemotaxis response regulator protein-glutamate methylesterase [Candidatus Sulfotelmatobacter sp.]|nr:chemotaxis response regulator protein-glutamate methylesterase [Candidatus Sulfotelmatobacter sp.]